MTKRDIQGRAAELLARFEAETGIRPSSETAGPYATLPELCRWMGLTLFEDPLLKGDDLGELNRILSQVSYQKGLSLERGRFTIAHELGHVECHPGHEGSEDEGTIDDAVEISEHDAAVFRSYDPRSRAEIEANQFAAALLMPLPHLKRRLQDEPNWSVESLSAYFGVSRRAMVSQLCGLLTNVERRPEEGEQSSPTLDLDEDQKEAVRMDAPTLVVAGPGAGKTRILVERFAWLVAEKKASPERILALTFANKAATEMVERLSMILPDKSAGLSVSTFHSFGVDLLKGYGDRLPSGKAPRMITPAEAFALVKQNLRDLPLGSFEDLRRPTMHLKTLLETVSRAKDELVGPERFAQLAQAEMARLKGSDTAAPEELTKAHRCLEAAEFYRAYEYLLERHGCADFGDLIVRAVELLHIPEVAKAVHHEYEHILVDETQDINYATAQMLALLDGGRGVIWVVGDPRQSIYRFRGASSVSLVDYAATYPGTKTKELLKNYRSVPEIVAFGQSFAVPRRVSGDDLSVPRLESGRKTEPGERRAAVEIAAAADEHSELCHVASEIQALGKEGIPLEDAAILCRTRAQAQKVANVLASRGIPTTWAGSLDSRPAFKDLGGALYLANDDLRGLVRLWGEDASDLRTLFQWAKGVTRSASRVLYEAKSSGIDGLSEAGVRRCTELWSVARALRPLPSATSVIERYAFDLSVSLRSLLVKDDPTSYRAKSTVAETISLSSAYEASVGEEERGAAAFLAFLRAAIEAGELKAGTGEAVPGVVTVLTIHRSKGLEWPVVFLPYTADKKMPPGRKRVDERPIPAGMVNGEDLNDEAIEMACLFYVAATRARERLVLSYSARYGPRSPSGLSPYVAQILDSLGEDRNKVRRVDVATVARPENAFSSSVAIPFVFDGPIPYSALTSYDGCPRQFEHRYVLGLGDDETGYRDFHSAIYAAQQWALDNHPDDVPPSEEKMFGRYESEWATRQPEGHWYDARYRTHALRILSEFRARWLVGRPRTDARYASLEIKGHQVSIPFNEIVDEDGETLLITHHYGRPAAAHLKDERQALLMHFGRQRLAPSARSAFRYMTSGSVVHTPFDESGVRKVLEKTAGRVADATSGHYPAQPDAYRCRSCASSLICASTSDEDE